MSSAKFVVFGWNYADNDISRPFTIEDFWVEEVYEEEEPAANLVAVLNRVHLEMGTGDTKYDYSGPFFGEVRY